jgi:hypothetical protein
MSFNAFNTMNKMTINSLRRPISYTYTDINKNIYRILFCKNTGKYSIILNNTKKIGYVCLGGGAAGIKNITIGSAITGYGGGGGAINSSDIAGSAITLSSNTEYIINVGRGGYGTSTTIALTNEIPATASSIGNLVTSSPGLPNGSTQPGTNNGVADNSGNGGINANSSPGAGGNGGILSIADINLSGSVGGGGGGAVYGEGTSNNKVGGSGGNGGAGGGASYGHLGGSGNANGTLSFSTDSGTVTFGGPGSNGVTNAFANPPGDGGSGAENTGGGGGAPFSNGNSSGGSGVVLIYYQINESGTGYFKFYYGIYTILLFITTGSFTITLDKTTKIGYLCVGGGGAGGNQNSRGGNGGAVNYASYTSSGNNIQFEKDTTYPITVGASQGQSSIGSLVVSLGGNISATPRTGFSDGVANSSGIGGAGSNGGVSAGDGTVGVNLNIPDIGLTGIVAGGGGGSTNATNPAFTSGDGKNGGGGGANYTNPGQVGLGSTGEVYFATNPGYDRTGTGLNGSSGGNANGGTGGANTGAGGGGFIGSASGPGGSGFVVIYYPT